LVPGLPEFLGQVWQLHNLSYSTANLAVFVIASTKNLVHITKKWLTKSIGPAVTKQKIKKEVKNNIFFVMK
jgi:hypothetical protein